MAGRTELKSFFVTGAFPTESNFASFIDSTFNLTDDLGTSGQVPYVNAGATNLDFSDNLKFDGTKTSLASGTSIDFSSLGSYSFAGGKGLTSGDREIIASGRSSFNFSENTSSQTNGFGALADYCAILGGYSNHISTRADGAATVGGRDNQFIVDGTSFSRNSTIIGGNSHTFTISSSSTLDNSFIIGGNNNNIIHGSGGNLGFYGLIGSGNCTINSASGAFFYVMMLGADGITADQSFTTYIENLCLQADRFVYVGMPLNNGSWRVGGDGVSSVVFARRESGTYNTKFIIDDSGALVVASITDVAAPNSSLYYSTTQARLVYKDSGGTVNNLY